MLSEKTSSKKISHEIRVETFLAKDKIVPFDSFVADTTQEKLQEQILHMDTAASCHGKISDFLGV